MGDIFDGHLIHDIHSLLFKKKSCDLDGFGCKFHHIAIRQSQLQVAGHSAIRRGKAVIEGHFKFNVSRKNEWHTCWPD